jgi:hypothetical protein
MKRHGIRSKEAILSAIEAEYDWRMEPRLEPLKDISIAWDVWSRARVIQSSGKTAEAVERHTADQARIKDLTLLVESANRDLAKLELDFDANLKRLNEEFKTWLDKRTHRKLCLISAAYSLLVLFLAAYQLWTMGVF